MKYLILIIFVFGVFPVAMANEPQVLDTLYANEKMNLAIFFPSEIRQGIVGSDNFVFTYNREKGQTLGLLKAAEGETSNLLVITVDGNVYSYMIAYSEKLSEFNRFVSPKQRIGNENKGQASLVKTDSLAKPISRAKGVSAKKTNTARLNPEPLKKFIQKSCASLLDGPERKSTIKRKKGMSLGVRNIVYYEDLFFVQYEIKNASGIDFDIASLELLRMQGNNKRKSSYQETRLDVLHTYGMPEKVHHGETIRFVRVYRKTTLGDSEKFLIRLKEANGNREIQLKWSQ